MIRVWVYEGRDAFMRLRPRWMQSIIVPERIDFRKPGGHPLELVFGNKKQGERVILSEPGQTRDLIHLGFEPRFASGTPEQELDLDQLNEEWRRITSFYVVESNVRTFRTQRKASGR